jgi:hypothetical protein
VRNICQGMMRASGCDGRFATPGDCYRAEGVPTTKHLRLLSAYINRSYGKRGRDSDNSSTVGYNQASHLSTELAQ